MKLVPAASWRPARGEHGHEHERAITSTGTRPERHGHHGRHQHARRAEHAHDSAQGIEWEDDMVEVNRITTPANTRWKLVDRETGAENAADRLDLPRR